MQFHDLSEAQILALAVTAEEKDARIYLILRTLHRLGFSACFS